MFDDLTFSFGSNIPKEYLVALAVFLLATIVFWVINFIALKHFEKLSKKTKTDIDDTVIEIIKSLKPPFYIFLAFYIGISFLSLHYIADKVVTAILLFWIILQVSTAAGILVKFAVRNMYIMVRMMNIKSEEQINFFQSWFVLLFGLLVYCGSFQI